MLLQNTIGSYFVKMKKWTVRFIAVYMLTFFQSETTYNNIKIPVIFANIQAHTPESSTEL